VNLAGPREASNDLPNPRAPSRLAVFYFLMPQTKVLKTLAAACLGLAIALAGSGCASQSAIRLVSNSDRTPVAKPLPPPNPSRYLIQPQDLLYITFAGEPDYNQQVRVDWRGKIDVPTIAGENSAELTAAGLTPIELADRITEFGKKNKILVTQRAQVFVQDYTAKYFTVLGQVNKPGRYFFDRGQPQQIDLGEAVAIGGGYTRLARQSRVLVKRGAQVYCVDLRRLNTTGKESFAVRPGDIITVSERIF
jgi:protein involved in polysaccharide export with SLBB domain